MSSSQELIQHLHHQSFFRSIISHIPRDFFSILPTYIAKMKSSAVFSKSLIVAVASASPYYTTRAEVGDWIVGSADDHKFDAMFLCFWGWHTDISQSAVLAP